jgi:hypothetical protein
VHGRHPSLLTMPATLKQAFSNSKQNKTENQKLANTGNNRTRLVLLAVGAASGLIMASTGLLSKNTNTQSTLPDHLIARVGNQDIPKERYQQLIKELAADKKSPLDAQDRQFVLDRLIDEELLILRGIELGLSTSSPEIRKTIAASVISQVATEAGAMLPQEDALLQLYQSDPEYFAKTGRYQLKWWRLPGTDAGALSKARSAYEELKQGKAIDAAMAAAGFRAETILPNDLLPLSKISDYLGPELSQQIAQMQTGSWSDPLVSNGDYHLLYLLDHQLGEVPEFEAIRPLVESEYLRRAGDRALRDYLGWLRTRSQIQLRPEQNDP